ncbi:MAG TPA: neutral/alkaline non-lysosomal ceramidase N-terminal domain-containing protein [Bacteroidales bacterium]|nr:neutral/alkaline non-lysosomal ceramidase N-terminal domain-containing protein [Bacteroidales bacterium]HQM70204.1 neutral/alkaline non-lysosomal ceramidase N-terminal domain-containing protein [Bacteroidales bacterium]
MNLKKLFSLFTILTVSVVLFGQLPKQEVNKGVLKAGFSMADITPSIPVKLYGYASRKTYSEGVHDPLTARAVVFESNGKKILFVSTDIGSYPRDVFPVFQRAIMDRYGLKESEIFLSTIHSHSSPVLSLNPQTGDPNNIQYTKSFQDKLLALVGGAIKNMKPVNIGAGKGSSPVGANRREMLPDGSITLGRNPNGITDKEVLVLKISDTDGKPVGALYDYATHSTSLGPSNMLISGDVLGLSAQFTEKILGKDVVTPVFAGASGNIDPWYRVLPSFNNEPGWVPEPVLLGTLLGEEVVHVFRKIKDIDNPGEIVSDFEVLECPAKITAENKALPDTPATVPVNITVARIGNDIAFVAFSVEMLTEIGMEIKAGSPFRNTFVITHCNGASGYLVPEELYKEGGYEVSTTRFQIGSADMVVKKTLRMLYDL